MAVTSFWKSMKALAVAGLRSVGSSVSVTPEPVRSAVTAWACGRRVAAGVAGGLRAGGGAVGERGGDAPEAAAGAGDVHGLGLLAGQEGLERLVPGEAALGVGEEVQAGGPAAAHQHARRRRCRAAAPALPFSIAVDAERLHPQAAGRCR